MKPKRLLLVLLLLLTAAAVSTATKSETPPSRQQRSTSDPEIVKATAYALGELRKLSESSIYETLELKRIVKAETGVGVFHSTTYLQVEVASPHLASELKVVPVELVVMENLADGSRTVAVDEFPRFDEDAVEEFWIRMTEDHRERRDKMFARIEGEGRGERGGGLDGQPFHRGKDSEAFRKASRRLSMFTDESLRSLLTTTSSPNEREIIRSILEYREAKARGQSRVERGGL